LLSGHSDVVPVDGQAWDSDPFDVAERDGNLFGRGVADMKSFIAIALAMVPDFVGARSAMPLHLALTYDEELGCLGAPRLIELLKSRPIRPRLCIIGEPTLMQPVVGHKGKTSVRCRVHGHESHSALTHAGVNAVEAAAEVVAYLKQMARRKRDLGPFDDGYSPPYTTIHTGVIAGGTAINIVPKECHFYFEMRCLPADDPKILLDEAKRFAAGLLSEMHKVSAATGFDFEEVSAIPALSASPDDDIVHLTQFLTGANALGKVSFGSEGGLFQEAGVQTVLCGPGFIGDAHKPNEFVSLEQIRLCERFMQRLLKNVLTAEEI
jgi:acetylornithine deacetylase